VARPRVLHLITELNVGGTETALARLMAHLDRERFEPSVACLYGGDGPVAETIRELGIPVTDLGMAHRWRLDALWRLYRLLRSERPTILHTWLFHANVPGRLLGRLARVPIVISGERTMGMESRWRYALNRITQSLADRIVCVSPQVADFAIRRVGIPDDKVVVIPNGLYLPDFECLPGRQEARLALGLPVAGALVGVVARLDPVKRLDVLLQALAMQEDVSAVIVGYGPEEHRLKALVGDLGIEGHVRFAGHQRDVRPWLAAMDVFVLSSDWEGMSNALLEAMAAHLPVVATATGGTPDVVVDGETGFLVPPGDPPALARALGRLLADPGLRDRMGQAGRHRISESFSIDQMVELIESLYEGLLAGQPSPGRQRS
jgi:glycosyltransferase involved in cell wall biosynthesis